MFGRNRGFDQSMQMVQSRRMNIVIFLGFLILGAYFINIPFNFLQIPEQITKFNEWITLAGGIFMLLGAIYYFKSKRA